MTTERTQHGANPERSTRGDPRRDLPTTPVRSVPIASWTIADRAAWERAIAPGVRLRKGGVGAHLAPVTQDDLARRYGYFIDHLIRNDRFERESHAAGQVTPDHVERFVDELRIRISSVTTAATIHKLRRAAQLLDPNRNFTWLAEIEKDFALMMRPQSKDHRIVDPDRLFEAGLTFIEEATENPGLTPLRRARQVRNGLMVALMVLCPIRLKNFAALELQASFRRVGTRWWVVLDRKVTKSGRPDERRVPRDLDAAIETYLLLYRAVLAATKTKGGVETFGSQACLVRQANTPGSGVDPLANIAGPLWLTSNGGRRMTYSAVERSLTETTCLTLGVAVSPHLFRTCAATAIYTHAGDNLNLASGVLQHIDRRVTEEHYNRATSISAARQYAEIVKNTRA
ncbi:site-specific integrase [Methylocapsa sp. D3K7]|uniref:site-specific integrase n=1 Tax=Methylocapsa sp. D3K7 TaxID=3041435 RepID=UPI00244EB9B2|nr:site-specific integrase [Methylocapsa sp. D3K7]WGJ15980.1 site-specific integrase [Methylocapsa sp. D3K7]